MQTSERARFAQRALIASSVVEIAFYDKVMSWKESAWAEPLGERAAFCASSAFHADRLKESPRWRPVAEQKRMLSLDQW